MNRWMHSCMFIFPIRDSSNDKLWKLNVLVAAAAEFAFSCQNIHKQMVLLACPLMNYLFRTEHLDG